MAPAKSYMPEPSCAEEFLRSGSTNADEIAIDHQTIPIHTDLRSIASMMEVEEAQLPTNDAGGDRGSSFTDWNTTQVGGDEAVYGLGGPVLSGDQVVGHSLVSGGVIAVPKTSPGSQCRGAVSDMPQSFWIFSTSACGAYGFQDLAIAHAGRTAPVGEIVLTSPRRILIRSGSGLLLRTTGS